MRKYGGWQRACMASVSCVAMSCVAVKGCWEGETSVSTEGRIHGLSVLMEDSTTASVVAVVVASDAEYPTLVRHVGRQSGSPLVSVRVEGMRAVGEDRVVEMEIEGRDNLQGLRFLVLGAADSVGLAGVERRVGIGGDVIKDVRMGAASEGGQGVELVVARSPRTPVVQMLVGVEQRDGGRRDWRHLLPDSLREWEWEGGPVVTWNAIVANLDAGGGIGGPVLFGFDSAAIDGTGMDVLCNSLNNVVNVLNGERSATIGLEGHADSVGDADYNRQLGERRALSVRDFFTRAGLDGSWFATVSHGENRPAVMRGGRGLDRENRRVEFRLMRHEGHPLPGETRDTIVLSSLVTRCGAERR